MDVSPFDNSKTQKEGVSRTDKGCDCYAPMLGYLGAEGYLINVELREGSQHCQRNTPAFIDAILKHVRLINDNYFFPADFINPILRYFINPFMNIVLKVFTYSLPSKCSRLSTH